MANRGLRHQSVADLVLGISDQDEAEKDSPDLLLTPAREEALEKWKTSTWDFLTGVDPDTGEPILRTVDQKDKIQPVKAFPDFRYLHYLCDLIDHEPKLQIEKASQMVITTTIVLAMARRCAFEDGYKVLLSKHKEEEAEIILSEKIRTPWSLMPEWLRRQIPVSLRPKNRCTFRKPKGGIESSILGLTETAAMGEARGQTYQVGLIDEAEFQDLLQDLITAMLPRCGQLIIWSTPAKGGDGVGVFRDYLADDPVTVKRNPDLDDIRRRYSIPGMSIRRNNEKNFTISRIEHTADPAKRSAEWVEAAKREYPSVVDFMREMKIDRTSNAGRPYYPQFGENPRRYVAVCPELPQGIPILRGWDFGGSNPACVWGAWSSRLRIFWFMRELLGSDIDTYAFRDLVKYLSGQISIETLQHQPRAMESLEELRLQKEYPEPPWFQGPHRFLDFTGHEGFMGPRGLVPADQAKSAIEILGMEDIHLYAQYTPRSAKGELINGLSRLRVCTLGHDKCNGHPGLLVDPACSLLYKGFLSGIVFAKSTNDNPDPREPAKHAVYSHLHDASGYILTNIVKLEDADFFQASFGADGQIIFPELPEQSQMMSYLSDGVNP